MKRMTVVTNERSFSIEIFITQLRHLGITAQGAHYAYIFANIRGLDLSRTIATNTVDARDIEPA